MVEIWHIAGGGEAILGKGHPSDHCNGFLLICAGEDWANYNTWATDRQTQRRQKKIGEKENSDFGYHT